MASEHAELLKQGTSMLSSLFQFLQNRKLREVSYHILENAFQMLMMRGSLIRALEIYTDFVTSSPACNRSTVESLWGAVRSDSWELRQLVDSVYKMTYCGIRIGTLERTYEYQELMEQSRELLIYLERPDPMHADEEIALLMHIASQMRSILEKVKALAFEFDAEVASRIGYNLGTKASYKEWLERTPQ